jgi:hypothetical protein
MADTWTMNDEFHFGERAKRPARLGKDRAEGTRSFDGRIIWIAVGLALAGVVAFIFLRGADEAGKQVADSQSNALDQIDTAYDAAAQGSMGRAMVVARSLYAERGSFTTDLATLSAFDPGITFTAGPSNGPTSIAYAASDSAFGAAVMSESGTCWWVKTDVRGVTTYGSGTTCTGEAALGASAPSW